MAEPMIPVRLLASWIGRNAEQESVFSTPDPGWNVNAHALLDYIAEESGVSQEVLGEWANPDSTGGTDGTTV